MESKLKIFYIYPVRILDFLRVRVSFKSWRPTNFHIKLSKEKMLKAESTTVKPATKKLEDVLSENNLLSKFTHFLIGKPVPKVKQLPPPFNSK